MLDFYQYKSGLVVWDSKKIWLRIIKQQRLFGISMTSQRCYFVT